MKKLLFSLSLLIFCFYANGQKNYRIDGMAFDTLNDPLVAATVLLLEKSDSTMIDFTRTDLDGSFVFKKVPNGQHIVKITYIGYIPLAIDASSTDGSDVDLGRLELVEIAEELMEVVIKAAKAPMKIRGDTIEYDASTFKVPPGSTVEELLRRLPGMEVDSDGSVTSEGKNVDRVTVDGKQFFGSDPKAATKNLPAEGISKVQVFDTKTEEEEITGSTGEAETKTMNLELKEDFKAGGFGKVVGGLGTKSRAELKGNYNKFNEKFQFSILGVGNNTGRNGLGWDDYQDFMGSNSFNFNDGGDYGFGGGGGRFYSFGGGGNGLESSIQNVFFNNRSNGGFPQNYNGGVNVNYDHNDTKLNTVYYFNQAGLERETNSRTERFFEDFTSNNISNVINDDVSSGHRAEIGFEQEIDTFHTIKMGLNLASINTVNREFGYTELSRNNQLSTTSDFVDLLNTNGYLINGQVLLRKKFAKRGRRMGVNASYLNTSLEDEGTLESENLFYGENEVVDDVNLIDQVNNSLSKKGQFKANALYVEPLSKKFFFQTFFNHSTRIESGDRDVFDITNENQVVNGFLSRIYRNQIMLNRLGSEVRYTYQGVNISLGGAYQHFDLKGDYDGKGAQQIEGEVDKQYVKWIPNVSINFQPIKNSYFRTGYDVRAQEPSIQNLQPIVNNRNPLFIREGNPALVPSIDHNVNMYLSINKPATSLRFSVNIYYTYNVDEIINKETVDENLVTYTTPINYTGGQRIGNWTNLSIPIWKNKLTARMNFSYNYGKSFAIVNEILNETISNSYRPSIRLNFTASENLSLYANASFNVVNTEYSINTSQDQRTLNNTYSVEFNAKTVAGIFLNSNFNYAQFSNERFGVDQGVPILNASIYRRFLEGDKLEARLSVYDALDRNLNVRQFASGNQVTTSETFAIGRYLMLSVTYNIRGMKSDVRKDGWW
ncbi:outer membrane beta-barrel protein [Portibacter marinus]|uniref:outer membrane beta-barrel protein n=1 Tax=Portibacter marinus TaxID=2898660 RepID=UPI001F200D28|nr:outer membrane beta-barrel protein [Portibacter marinus]